MQGAWALLLSRYGGGEDVVFGTIVSGRPADLAGVTSMVGLFINTLPTRVRIDGARPVREWLRDVQAVQSEDRRHESSRWRSSRPGARCRAGPALFDSILVFENYPFDADGASRHGLRPSESERDVEPTNYALSVVVEPGDALAVNLDYDPAAFDAATVERLRRQIVEDPAHRRWRTTLDDRRASTDPAAAEDTGPGPAECCSTGIGGRWPRHRRARCPRCSPVGRPPPDAPAVRFATLTYREFDERVNRLARLLIAAGVGPEALRRAGTAALAGSGRRDVRGRSPPVVPMCRWIRIIRPSASPTCSRRRNRSAC